MSKPVIIVDKLSKSYRIGHKAEKFPTFRDAVVGAVASPFRRLGALARGATTTGGDEIFWALKDVSFEVQRGEVVGIIGRNGAGKSTLLKVLSRITEPTSGCVRMRGRVASLLEVGTGFHPELTGRENIYMNGAILGMRREEIKRKFDEIVAFAEVEKFLDTPVKFYSSGMYVRLAFAVAAHLEPEILIVDEVLAVGDAEFQKKCLGKMQEVSKGEGRTVLFVSHNMAAVEGLCTNALLFANGQLALAANPASAIQQYLQGVRTNSSSAQPAIYLHRGRRVAIERLELVVNGKRSTVVSSGDQCSIHVFYRLLDRETDKVKLSVSLLLLQGEKKVANLWTNCESGEGLSIGGHGAVVCHIRKWPFRSHQVRVDVYSHIGPEVEDYIEGALVFDSHDGDFYGSGVMTNADQGLVLLEHTWAHA